MKKITTPMKNERKSGLPRAAAVVLGVIAASALSVSVLAAPADSSQYIGEAKAKSTALQHAGVPASQATFINAHLDRDDGCVVYDVEFYSGDTEYDYEIDAISGTVREYDRDIEYYSVSSANSPANSSANQYIGEAKAKSIALGHAGVTESQATFIKAHLDHDDGIIVYDVEFYSGNTEYDYEIGAVDGAVLGYDRDIEYYSVPAQSAAASNASGQYIGEAKAKSAALTHAGITETQATFIKAYLDYDDGYVVYDVEFYSSDTEYDYEIDAVSGEILEYDREIEYYAIPSSSASAPAPAAGNAAAGQYIGEAKAKSIALSQAGLSETQVRKMKVELDRENGRMVYEVDFKNGQMEYEYEIDASNGTILKSDVEYDD